MISLNRLVRRGLDFRGRSVLIRAQNEEAFLGFVCELAKPACFCGFLDGSFIVGDSTLFKLCGEVQKDFDVDEFNFFRKSRRCRRIFDLISRIVVHHTDASHGGKTPFG